MTILSHLSMKAFLLLKGRKEDAKGPACGNRIGFNSVMVDDDGQIIKTAPVNCPTCVSVMRGLNVDNS